MKKEKVRVDNSMRVIAVGLEDLVFDDLLSAALHTLLHQRTSGVHSLQPFLSLN